MTRIVCALALLLLLTACGTRTHYPEASWDDTDHAADLLEDEIADAPPFDFTDHQMTDERYTKEDRLAVITNRLLVANADVCGRHVTRSYLIGVTPRPNAQPVVTAPVAVKASDQTENIYYGDQVWDVDNEPVGQSNKGAEILRRNLGRSARQNRQVVLTLTHAGTHKQFKMVLQPVLRCAYGFAVDYKNDDLNADADGHVMHFSPSMMDTMNGDDELAAVAGHEMAHNLFQHSKRSKIDVWLGKVIGTMIDLAAVSTGVNTGGQGKATGEDVAGPAYGVNFEREADYVGAYLMARAGFDPEAALTVMKKLAIADPEEIRDGGDHPAFAERIWNLQKTVDEIHAKQARGEILLPELD